MSTIPFVDGAVKGKEEAIKIDLRASSLMLLKEALANEIEYCKERRGCLEKMHNYVYNIKIERCEEELKNIDEVINKYFKRKGVKIK